MYDGTADQLSVSFPATEQFLRLGRVTVSGLALRLGVELSLVERLRLAIDAAVQQLRGAGVITLQASWEPGHLAIDLENLEVIIDQAAAAALTNDLTPLVDHVQINQSHIALAIEDPAAFQPSTAQP